MFIPDNYKLTYKLNDVKKTFRQYELHTAELKDLLPDLIRTEKNNGYNSITGAENLLRVRNAKNWNKCSLAGLRPTETKDFYYSDLLINGVKSLIVAYIPKEWETVDLRVCKQFYPKGNNDYRNRLINHIIKNF